MKYMIVTNKYQLVISLVDNKPIFFKNIDLAQNYIKELLAKDIDVSGYMVASVVLEAKLEINWEY